MTDNLESQNAPATPSAEGQPLRKFMTKAVKGASEEFSYNMSWVTSRRGFLKVYEDRLECGDWVIPYQDIEEAVLFQTRSAFIPCNILKIRTAESTYQFGLNGNKYWKGELPFEVTRQKGRLKYSLFSAIVRLVLIGVLIWCVFFR